MDDRPSSPGSAARAPFAVTETEPGLPAGLQLPNRGGGAADCAAMQDATPVTLRPVSAADAQVMSELYSRNWDHLRPWMPQRGDARFDVDTCRADLQREVAEHASGTAYYFITVAGGEAVGRVTLSNIVRRAWQNANLGYWIAGTHQRRGLTSAAVRLCLDFAFRHAGLHRVQAAIIPRNTASVRVAENAGMRREGVALRYLEINGAWEDHLIYAITREEWAVR